MNDDLSDIDLLRKFARQSDQTAFAGLVRRHLNLVYGTALRHVGSPDTAEEVTQDVFAALARKAWKFAPDDSLPAWLHRTALNKAREWWRGEQRRRRREQAAAELGTTMKAPEEQTAFRALVPLLDEALLSLREKDRTALLLRFYESRSLRDVGATLGLREDAAQKRVATALERLARFFRRRGFKTATTAGAAAALEHTAAAASATTASTVIAAALQSAPPVLAGVGTLLVRLAGLSKAQTAALCLALVVLPVGWQWKRQHAAGEKAHRAKAHFLAIQSDRTALQTEIERLRARVDELDTSVGLAKETVNHAAESVRTFAQWRARIRGEITGKSYTWPADSPFVRIPKSALQQIQVEDAVSPSGMLSQQERELLGLTPRERRQIEDALHVHFATLNNLIESQIYETNQARRFSLPESALASAIWVVPPLGDAIKSSGEELQSTLHDVLGDERWPLVKAQLEDYGAETLRRTLDLDAAKQSQTAGVWIQQSAGHLLVSLGWSCAFSTSSGGGVPLNAFLPNAAISVEPGTTDPRQFFASYNLPVALEQRVMAWVRQEAVSRLGKPSAP